MTDQIGGVVSRLSYINLLKHGRGVCGPKVEFVDIDAEWQTRHYSMKEKSYFTFGCGPDPSRFVTIYRARRTSPAVAAPATNAIRNFFLN